MKVSLFFLIMLFATSASASTTIQNQTITSIYLYGTDYTHFYLTNNCPQTKKYYSLFSSKVDVERFYSLILMAYAAKKKVNVVYETSENFCEVTAIFVVD